MASTPQAMPVSMASPLIRLATKLLASLGDTATDDLLHVARVYSGPLDQFDLGMAQELGSVEPGHPPVALPDRGSHCFDNHRLGHRGSPLEVSGNGLGASRGRGLGPSDRPGTSGASIELVLVATPPEGARRRRRAASGRSPALRGVAGPVDRDGSDLVRVVLHPSAGEWAQGDDDQPVTGGPIDRCPYQVPPEAPAAQRSGDSGVHDHHPVALDLVDQLCHLAVDGRLEAALGGTVHHFAHQALTSPGPPSRLSRRDGSPRSTAATRRPFPMVAASPRLTRRAQIVSPCGCRPPWSVEPGGHLLAHRAGCGRRHGPRGSTMKAMSQPRSSARDLTVIAVPFYFGSMAVEYVLLRRRAGQRGPTAADYERRDTVASLTMGVGSLVAPLVVPHLLRPITPGRGRFGKAFVTAVVGAAAVTTAADIVARRAAGPHRGAEPVAVEPPQSADDAGGRELAPVGGGRRRAAARARRIASVGGVATIAMGGVAAAATP